MLPVRRVAAFSSQPDRRAPTGLKRFTQIGRRPAGVSAVDKSNIFWHDQSDKLLDEAVCMTHSTLESPTMAES